MAYTYDFDGRLVRVENSAGWPKLVVEYGYDLRVHSLRKFFKTQLLAAGVQQDYVDYMMGHTIDTYHDLKGKTEFLRGKYAAANLSIEPEKISVASRVDQLKAFAQGLGLNPEQIINSLAFAEPHRSIVESEGAQIQVLSQAIKNVIKQEIMDEIKPTSSVFDADSPLYSSGAAEI